MKKILFFDKNTNFVKEYKIEKENKKYLFALINEPRKKYKKIKQKDYKKVWFKDKTELLVVLSGIVNMDEIKFV